MRRKYRMFLRGTVYWVQDNDTGKQETLRTKDHAEAERLFNAKNEAHRQPIINVQIARAYLMAGLPGCNAHVATRDGRDRQLGFLEFAGNKTRNTFLGFLNLVGTHFENGDVATGAPGGGPQTG